ncbi:MAG: VOC family protein [Pseudomonadales bacterium]|nr:VOC family protein [Pseudomonadales bacterium]
MLFKILRSTLLTFCLIAGSVGSAYAEDSISPTQVNHLNIVFSVTDADEVHEFYGGILGLERIANIPFPDNQYMIRYMAGATELKFIVTGQDLAKGPKGAGSALGIRLLALLLPLKEQDGILKRLKEAGREVPEMTIRRTPEGVFRYAFGMVYDGDDNQVEIVFLDEKTPREVFQQVQFGLSVSDHAPMDDFLTRVLQYKPVVTNDRIHRYEMGRTQIKFWEVPADVPAWNGGPAELIGMNLVQAIVPDVDAVRATVLARGGKIHTEPFALGTLATIMFVEGPDGILFEFAGPLLERLKKEKQSIF